MSDATKTAMDEAIAAHFADEMDGALVHCYLLQIGGESMDDMTNNQWSALRATAEGQSFITTIGLCAYVTRNLEIVQATNLD
jgi:hypothetical protein